MAAAMAGGKGKGKKKWSKGKTREKVQNKVLFDQETYDRCLSEVPKVRSDAQREIICSMPVQMKLITASALVERLKVNASLAKQAIKELEGKGLVRRVATHSTQLIFTRATNA